MEKLSYTVTTPEQVTIQFDQAGVGRRALAQLVDALILAVFFALIIIALVFLFVVNPFRNASQYVVGALIVLSFLCFWGYFIAFEYFLAGQTPGKRAMKIRVVRTDGRAVTFFSSSVRNLLRIIDFLPIGYLAGVICMMVDKHERRIGDLAAGTVVVVDRPLWRLRPALHDPASDAEQTVIRLDKNMLEVRLSRDAMLTWNPQLNEFRRRSKGMSAKAREEITNRIWNALVAASDVDLVPIAPTETPSVFSLKAKVAILNEISRIIAKRLKKGDRL